MNKNLLYTIVYSLIIFQSCGSSDNKEGSNDGGNQEKGVLENISEASSAVKNLSKLEQYAKEMEQRMNDLKKLDPVSKESLKASLPEELAGLKRNSFTVGEMSAISIASAKADYRGEDSDKQLSLEIMDGAGEAASAMASMLFLAFQTDKDSENQDGFEKTVDLNGSRALVKETTYNEIKNSEIQWLHNKRFILTLKGNAFAYDELAEIQKNLDLSNLK